MGIQLDWQIESERSQRQATEDPKAKKNRRKRRRNLAVAMFVVFLVVGMVAGVIIWRLQTYEDNMRRDLLDTVEIEVTALRVGDKDNFQEIHRSISQDWLNRQDALFDEYQQLKTTRNLQLTGEVLDVEMDLDESRARVVLRERLDNGVPYKVVWFYWHFDDENERSGWRRVPPDIQFWGEEDTTREGNVSVEYYGLDEKLGKALPGQLNEWLERGCILLNCPRPVEKLQVEVTPEPGFIRWDEDEDWQLIIPSPYHLYDRVPDNVAITPDLEVELARLLAAHLLQYRMGPDFQPVRFSDAEWLYNEYPHWLAAELVDNPAIGSAFLSSLSAQFGEQVPGTLLGNLAPGSRINILQTVTGSSLSTLSIEQLNALDWRGFFQWRLNIERTIALEGFADELYFSLYDRQDANADTGAHLRLQAIRNDPNYVTPTVQEVSITVGGSGDLLAYVTTEIPDSPIIFRWIEAENTWKRAS